MWKIINEIFYPNFLREFRNVEEKLKVNVYHVMIVTIFISRNNYNFAIINYCVPCRLPFASIDNNN